jgi:hypothetical protein
MKLIITVLAKCENIFIIIKIILYAWLLEYADPSDGAD